MSEELISKYYDGIMRAWPHAEEARELVAERIKKYASGRKINILDIGCGRGELTYKIKSKLPEANITGLDNDANALKIAKKKATGINFIEADFLNYVGDNKFDVVASAWMIHNYCEAYRKILMGNVMNHLSYGGMFINFDKVYLNVKMLDNQMQRIDNLPEEIVPLEAKYQLIRHEFNDLIRFQNLDSTIFEMTSVGFGSLKKIYRKENDMIFEGFKL